MRKFFPRDMFSYQKLAGHDILIRVLLYIIYSPFQFFTNIIPFASHVVCNCLFQTATMVNLSYASTIRSHSPTNFQLVSSLYYIVVATAIVFVLLAIFIFVLYFLHTLCLPILYTRNNTPTYCITGCDDGGNLNQFV